MRSKTLWALAAAALLIAGTVAAETSGRWVNVTVNEPASGTKVEVHLPLELVLTVLDGVDVEHFRAGKVELDTDVDVDWPKLLAAVKDAPDGQYVTVEDPEADVQVSKRGGTVLVHVTGKGAEAENIDVKVPAELLAALSVDDQNRIDVKALVASLAALPNGDLVTMTSTEANVRVWIE